MRFVKVLLGAILFLVISGCATPVKPGLDSRTQKLDLQEDCLFLLKAELANDYKPAYQPNALVLHVETPNASKSEERLNFTVDQEGSFPSPSENKYIFRARVKPGKYIVRGITGTSGTFVHGMFFMPLHCEVEAKKGTIIDLGKVVAKTRERHGNEFRSGPAIPLIDQAVTGFSGSTFEVQTMASQDDDLKLIKTLFPALRGEVILSEPLPPFDRDKAQKWWEAH